MAFELGDVINIAKLAWDVYICGWTSESGLSPQYALFGSDLLRFAGNLDILVSILRNAQESLRSHGIWSVSEIRWDPESLVDIVGDLPATLRECYQLLDDNKRYGSGPNDPLRNIEWNLIVQPSAERLWARIQLQNARIQNVLKPFEIDLLTRIHEDLDQRISAVHDNVSQVHSRIQSLVGVLVPNPREALDQQDPLGIRLLRVPPEVEEKLEGVFSLHPAWREDQYPPLRDMADAFIASLDQSTKCFQPGLTIAQKAPPASQYLNLLKCLFLMKTIHGSEELANVPPQSHWPSYVRELEERLSHECNRFSRSMVAPTQPLEDADDKSFNFWIAETHDLLDMVTTKVMMEELIDIPLFSNQQNVSKRMQLIRHAGTHDKKYRLVLSAIRKQAKGAPQQQKEVVDFDVSTATINPLYAMPSGTPKAPYEMILEANNKIHRLAFSTLEDAFLFQQGITGFKVVDNYFESHTKVSFAIEGQGAMLEDASAQLWIQRRLNGNLVLDNSDSRSSLSSIYIPPSPRTIPGSPPVALSTITGHDPLSHFGISHHYRNPESISAELSLMSLSSSPGKMSTRPGVASGPPIMPPMGSTSHFPPSPNRVHTFSTSAPVSVSPPQESNSSGSFLSKWKKKRPSQEHNLVFGASSTTATATSATIGSSSSSATTTETSATVWSNSSSVNTTATSVTTGSIFSSTSGTIATVHGASNPRTAGIQTMPLKPMLVLFTCDSKTDQHSIVTISIDEKTLLSPQSCWCQQGAGPDGNPCKITVLKQSEGRKVLETRRLNSSTSQWDLLPLCANRRRDRRGFAGAEWRGLNRVSILFPSVEARFYFGGGFCVCKRQTEREIMECLKKGHVGLLGQVRVHYRNQVSGYFNRRYAPSVHVSNLPLAGGWGKNRPEHLSHLQDFHEATWEWEVPEFLRRAKESAGTGKLDLDGEVILTTTAGNAQQAGQSDLCCRYGLTRAYTWGEILKHLDPLIAEFVSGLLDHVSRHLDVLSLPQSYEFKASRPYLNASVSYDNARLTMKLSPLIRVHGVSNFLRSIQIVCATLRPANPRRGGCLSVARWHLEQYQLPTLLAPGLFSTMATSAYAIRQAMTLEFEPLPKELDQHGCWQKLFDMELGTVVSLDKPLSDYQDSGVGEGIEIPFGMMVSLAAVEFALVVEGGIILAGYSTIILPVGVTGNIAQWHLITNPSNVKGQINPYTTELGPRLKTTDLDQFQEMRCFLGWCRYAQINLGTEGLQAKVGYSKGEEVGKSLVRDGFSILSQLGASAPLNAVLGLQTNLKYTSHWVRFTRMNNYKKLLRDTAQELAMIYDSGTRQCWLVPKLSLLLHMTQAYAIWARTQTPPFVSPHSDASALVKTLDGLGEISILDDDANFGKLILRLNTNLLDTAPCSKNSSGKTLYGFEFMDVVITPGRGTFMKKLTVGSSGRNWLEMANVVDAVVVCSGLGEAISPVSDPETVAQPNAICNSLPKNLDYLAATIPCLNMLAYRRGVNALFGSGAGRVPISQGIFWDIRGDPFRSCSHDEGNCGSCWREGRTQQIFTLRSFMIEVRSKPAMPTTSVEVPMGGAVAFGGRRVSRSRGWKQDADESRGRQIGGVGKRWRIRSQLLTLLALETEV